MDYISQAIYFAPILAVIGLGGIIYLFGFKSSVNLPSFENLSEVDNKKGRKKKNKTDKKSAKSKDVSTKKVVKSKKDDLLVKEVKENRVDDERPKKNKEKRKKADDELPEKPQVMEGWMTIPKKEKKQQQVPVKANSPKHNLKDAKGSKNITPNKVSDLTHKLNKEVHNKEGKNFDETDNYDDYPLTLEAAADKMYENEPEYEPELEYKDNMQDFEDHIRNEKANGIKAGSSGTSTSNSTVNDWELLNIPQIPGKEVPNVSIPKIKPILKLTTETDWQGSTSNDKSAFNEYDSQALNQIRYSSLPSTQCWGAQLLPGASLIPTDDDSGQWYSNYESYFDDGDDVDEEDVIAKHAGKAASVNKLGKQSPIQRSYLEEIIREKERRIREQTRGTYNGNLFEFADDISLSISTPVYQSSGSSSTHYPGSSSSTPYGSTYHTSKTSGGTGDVGLNKRLGLVYENVMPPIRQGRKNFNKEDSGKDGKLAKTKKPVNSLTTPQSTNNEQLRPDELSATSTSNKKKKKNTTTAGSGPIGNINSPNMNLVSVTG